MIIGYAISQLQGTDENERDWRFMSYDFAINHGFSLDKYTCVWTDNTIEYADDKCNELLDELYYIFNMNHPAEFQGHSLSMSDIVTLEYDSGDIRNFYVDRIGFTEI